MDKKMDIHSGASCTQRARLAPSATASSGGLEVAAGSGEGAPTGSEDQEEQSGPDRISDLPDGVLGEIISRLSTKEGVRTQILARCWRPVWPTIPLNLDSREIPVARLFNPLETIHIEIISRASAYSEELARIRYIGTWHQGKTVPDDGSSLPESIFSSHVGAVLRLCIPVCYLQCRPSTVHAWIESPRLNNLQIPDHYVEVLELPLVKRLLLVEVDISDFSLQSMINSSCPALECLLLVRNGERHRITINSPNLVSISIRGEKGEFIIEDAPSLQRLIHDLQSNNMEVFIVSAPKLETLGKFRISLDSTGLMGGNFPDGARNIWRRKHREFLKEHIIYLKTVMLEDYEKSGKNTEFARFFILNATELETMRIKFRFPSDFTQEFYEEQQKLFLWENKAPKHAHLKLSA
nr:F-box/FBD/LRR-repeat protein At1g16930-like [Aegilops tauschii subsp. strangulata]